MTGAVAAVVWVLVAGILFAVETATAQMVCIWFSAGALVAIIPGAMGAPVWFQLLVFLICSLLFLYLVRPLVRERISVKKQPTNADMVVGQTGMVLEEIDNLKPSGRVSAMGLTWTARSQTDIVIPKGARVYVLKIEGVKLIVTPFEERGGTY